MFVHGDNLKQKESHKEKYTDQEAKNYLAEIRIEYDKWNKANERNKQNRHRMTEALGITKGF